MDIEKALGDLEEILERSKDGISPSDAEAFNELEIDLIIEIHRVKLYKTLQDKMPGYDARFRAASATKRYFEHVRTPQAQEHLFRLVGVLYSMSDALPDGKREFYQNLIQPENKGRKTFEIDVDSLHAFYLGLDEIKSRGIEFIRCVDHLVSKYVRDKPNWLLLHIGEAVDNLFDLGCNSYDDDVELKAECQRFMHAGMPVSIFRFNVKDGVYRVVPRDEAKILYEL